MTLASHVCLDVHVNEIIKEFPERKNEIIQLHHRIYLGSPFGEILHLMRVYDDDTLMIVQSYLRQIIPHKLIDYSDLLERFMSDAMKTYGGSVIKQHEIFKEKFGLQGSLPFVLVFNDVENNVALNQIQFLKHLQEIVNQQGLTLHFIFSTYRPTSSTIITPYTRIVFKPLGCEQMIQICLKALNKELSEKEYKTLIVIIKHLTVYKASRTYILTSTFNVYNKMKEFENEEDNSLLNSYLSQVLSVVTVGHNTSQDSIVNVTERTYHLNYLLHAAYIISKKASRVIKIGKVYAEYEQNCPNPLSFSLFVLVFQSCVLDGIFQQVNKDYPMLINSYSVHITQAQFHAIDSALHPTQHTEIYDA
ncbi:Origin recognition complex subunit [Entamoeba marina]